MVVSLHSARWSAVFPSCLAVARCSRSARMKIAHGDEQATRTAAAACTRCGAFKSAADRRSGVVLLLLSFVAHLASALETTSVTRTDTRQEMHDSLSALPFSVSRPGSDLPVLLVSSSLSLPSPSTSTSTLIHPPPAAPLASASSSAAGAAAFSLKTAEEDAKPEAKEPKQAQPIFQADLQYILQVTTHAT